MNRRIAVGAATVSALLVCSVLAQDSVKSGPSVGKSLAAFHPLNVTGSQAGKKHCLV